MIFYFKTNGHLVYNSQTEICQGSNGANVIYVVAPFNSSSQVTARIILPNGKTLETEFLTLRKDLSAECFSIDEKGLSIWSCDVPCSMTKYYGLLRIQFAFTSLNETITTESVSIVIKKGVCSQEDIQIEDTTTIEKIKKFIVFVQQNLESKLDIDESETSNRQAYVKRANGVQAMMDISEQDGGSIVRRQIDGNIYAGDPESYNDATPKYYVDNSIAEVKNNNYNRTQIDNKFTSYYNKNDINSKLANIYTKDQTNSKLTQEFYNKTEINEKLNVYAKTEDINSRFDDCVSEDRLTERLIPFTTVYDVNSKLLNYYSKTLTDKNFYKKTEIDNKLAQKQDKLTAGKNISLENNVVSTIDDKAELIEKRIIGYTVLVNKPSDWEQNYNSYYKNVGEIKEPIYEAITEQTNWEVGKFYSYTPNGVGAYINFNTEPDGTNYNFRKIIVEISIPAVANIYLTGWIQVFCNNKNITSPNLQLGSTTANTKIKLIANVINVSDSKNILKIMIYNSNKSTADGSMPSYSSFETINNSSNITKIQFFKNQLKAIPSGTEIYIYAIR